MRDDLLFVFNFHPCKSFNGYGILAPAGEYTTLLSSDDPEFGGYGLVDKSVPHFTRRDPLFEKDKKEWLLLYLPARSAQILRRKKPEEIGIAETEVPEKRGREKAEKVSAPKATRKSSKAPKKPSK